MKLTSGLYEQLVTTELHDLLADPDWVTTLEELGEDAAADLLSRHLFEAARRALRSRRGASKLQAQVGLANALLRELSVHAPDAVLRGDEVLPQVLLAAQTRQQQGLGTQAPTRPGIPLRHSELIVNGPRDRRVGLEIERELPSADRVDVLMSFVKWSGFVELKDALARFSGRLRLLTTTYMGATELEALQGMADLGADIRVSYDHRRTRLHAKAWLFQRDTGFGTALIGSSNLSKAALRDGCEWNVRLSQRDSPGLVAKFQNTFEQYWDDAGFEPFDAVRFRETLGVRHDPARDALVHLSRLRALPHQQSVLDALEAERAAGHHRNLVVAATGTGKTVVAALDYAR